MMRNVKPTTLPTITPTIQPAVLHTHPTPSRHATAISVVLSASCAPAMPRAPAANAVARLPSQHSDLSGRNLRFKPARKKKM